MVRTVLVMSLAALVVTGVANADAQRAEVVSVAADGSGPLTLATAADALESSTFSSDGRTVAFRTLDWSQGAGVGSAARLREDGALWPRVESRRRVGWR